MYRSCTADADPSAWKFKPSEKTKAGKMDNALTEDDNLPEISLVIPNPIPRINNGGISLILKWARAKIKAEIIIPKIIPNSLDKIGSKTPRKINSSNNGAKNVVVINKSINEE